MTKPSIKELITKAVLGQMPAPWPDWPVEDVMKKWWQTGSRGDSLRLTDMGDMAFRVGEIEFYEYEFTTKIEGSYHTYILSLSRKIKCPYYLGVSKSEGKKNQPYIRLYDSKIAIMVSLYGDLDSYLKTLKAR
jgi:hypothetical protein